MLTDWQLDLDELTPDLNRRASSIEYSSGVSMPPTSRARLRLASRGICRKLSETRGVLGPTRWQPALPTYI